MPHLELALLRLTAQRLVTPMGTPTEAVRWMTAVQGQDYPGALTSVALRAAGGTRVAVEAALDAGEIVKSWPMRGTLHLLAAGDLPWLLALTSRRSLAKSAGRRRQLGLTEADLARAEELTVAALKGGGRRGRDELFADWRAGGLNLDGQRAAHLLTYLAESSVLCFGPTRSEGRGQDLVLLSEWVPNPRQLEREEALGELALRFYRSHGPATLADLMRWAYLTAADARTGTALARPELAELEVDGQSYLLDPATPDLLAAHRKKARGLFLLPGFDEIVLGYADRSAVLDPEHAQAIVPGNNGMFKATVLYDGRIIGTWRHQGRPGRRTVEATPLSAFPSGVEPAILQRYAELP